MQVKPSNILLNARGEARLADFGLARVAKQRDGTDNTIASVMRRLQPARRHPPHRCPHPATRVPQLARWRGDGADGRLCLRRHGAHGTDGAARRWHQAALPPYAQVAGPAAAVAVTRRAGRCCRQLGQRCVKRSSRGHSGPERAVGGRSYAAARCAGTARGDGGRRLRDRLRDRRLVVKGDVAVGGGTAVHHLRGGTARGALRMRSRSRLQRLPARRGRAAQEVPDLRPNLRCAAGGGARHARARRAHLRAARLNPYYESKPRWPMDSAACVGGDK
eukprot:scaffold58698_cov70-Phaeocystis_antarctica.AAC.9